MKKTIFIFSVLILSLLTLFQLSKYSLTSGNLQIEFLIAGIALLFLVIGIFLSKKSLYKKKNQEPSNQIDQDKVLALGLSKREYEILIKISEGYSNKEIAEQLFVSESTVKTHVSNLFSKLDVKRRTQAVQRAKEINIIE